ncbi:helix-turn-helix transcriptional regulator [Brevibacillus sp. LEMMJ03]|uniref:helix-turn-helix domain-containing protein n=1 Tax=Brevibacillus TaxID=55080 RepID=UPI00054F4366|nr:MULTISPECIES: helix-turn-helix transcriptional regulator [Brevibacillus]TRY23699.1 helix-turn-helix transcriptional regulator [Brevibacillus sp. LEMMJ03]
MEGQGKITLKEARKFRNLTLKEVSAEIGIPARTLRKYELSPGKTPLHIAVKLLLLYQVPIGSVKF